MVSRSGVESNILETAPPALEVEAETIDLRNANLVTLDGVGDVELGAVACPAAPEALLNAGVIHLRRD